MSDRGPGGGTVPYETRVQRFTLDVDRATGRISNFQIQAPIKFTSQGQALNGVAPNPTSAVGKAFDPEGIVINPVNVPDSRRHRQRLQRDAEQRRHKV